MMNYIKKSLRQMSYVSRWLVTELFEEHREFTPKADHSKGEVNDWLTYGPEIHQFPGRKEYIKNRKTVSQIPANVLNAYAGKRIEPENLKWSLYTPFEKKEVMFEGFWSEPTVLSAWAYNEIEASEEMTALFEIATSGGLEIWINNKKIHETVPFTRNELSFEKIRIPLNKGTNKCYIYFDDLAERDTQMAFQMRYLDEPELGVQVPIGAVRKEKVEHAEYLLKYAYFPYDCYKRGPLTLNFEMPVQHHFKIDTIFKVERCEPVYSSFNLDPGNENIPLGMVKHFHMGFQKVTVTIYADSIKMSRDFTVQIFPDEYLHTAAVLSDLKERKKRSLEMVAGHGEPNVHRALAMFSEGNSDFTTLQMLENDIDTVVNKADCSDFSIVMYYQLIKMNKEKNFLPQGIKEKLKSAILNYRYWYDEPGNDVMWFYSENHALMFHTSELLMGQLYPEETFQNANITGEEHYQRGYSRLIEWFKRFFREGLSEWHSSAYIPINVIGLLQIYEHSKDSKLKALAKKALNLIFYWLNKNSYKGYLTCSQGRVYEKELKGHYNTQTTHLMWIVNKEGNINYSGLGSVALALSAYTPENLDVKENENFTFENNQGTGLEAHVYTHKTNDGMLSSVLNYRPDRSGYQEHVIQASFGAEENVWINHPGEEVKRGNKRPSYWAGNGTLPNVVQYQGLAIIDFNIKESSEISYTHAYTPLYLFDEHEVTSHGLFLKKDIGWLALFAKNGVSLTKRGMDAYREVISEGKDNIWIMRLGNEQEYESFEEFKILMKQAMDEFNWEKLKFQDPIYKDITYHQNILTVQGKPQLYPTKGIEGTTRCE